VGIGTTTPSSALDVFGTLRLSGATSGFVGFAPAAVAGAITYTLPSADGASGEVLATNGSGVLSWAAAGGGASQWTTAAPNISFATGSVGVGTSTIMGKLSIGGGGISIDGVPQTGRWNSRVPLGNTTTSFTGLVNNTGMTIGIDGLPVIAYPSVTNRLTVAKCLDLSCATRTTTTIDASSPTAWSSIAISTDGFPVIAYEVGNDIMIAKCINAECTGESTLSTPVVGNADRPNIAIGTDGNPVIAYYNNNANDLMVAKCANTACSSLSTPVTILDSDWTSSGTAMAISTDGFPIIAYHDGAGGFGADELRVAKCSNDACTASSVVIVDSDGNVGAQPSITIGIDNLPVIAYYDATNGNLKVAHCANASCSSVDSITTLDSTGLTGQTPEIMIGANGLPIIAYYDASNANEKIAICSTLSCSASSVRTLDSVGDVGYYQTSALGADGLPIIAYNEIATPYLVKVLKCGNDRCLNYWTHH
ncbi:MAG: hypothetical protein Q7S16_04560, partial [bacterium]|nr:hypothetical protein [bacterium]